MLMRVLANTISLPARAIQGAEKAAFMATHSVLTATYGGRTTKQRAYNPEHAIPDALVSRLNA